MRSSHEDTALGLFDRQENCMASASVAHETSPTQKARQVQLQSLLEGSAIPLTDCVAAYDHILSFIGYSLSNSEGYPILSLALPDGSKWSKLIWPRKTLPKYLYRWNTPEVNREIFVQMSFH